MRVGRTLVLLSAAASLGGCVAAVVPMVAAGLVGRSAADGPADLGSSVPIDTAATNRTPILDRPLTASPGHAAAASRSGPDVTPKEPRS